MTFPLRDSDSKLKSLLMVISDFSKERDWDQFHTPKNLSMALTVEAAELMEHFQWQQNGDIQQIEPDKLTKIADEIGDVLIYLLRLSQKLGIDPIDAATLKMEKNRAKYPADLVRGKSLKYNEY